MGYKTQYVEGAETREPQEVRNLRALWAEVMRQAVNDYVGYFSVTHMTKARWVEFRQQIRGDAEAWFASDDEEVGSLRWICGLFDLDPGFVREQVNAKRHRPHRQVTA